MPRASWCWGGAQRRGSRQGRRTARHRRRLQRMAAEAVPGTGSNGSRLTDVQRSISISTARKLSETRRQLNRRVVPPVSVNVVGTRNT